MTRKNKALPWLLLVLLLGAAPIGCSSKVGNEHPVQVAKADDGGEEEVLNGDEDLDEFGRPKSETGGVFVTIGYVAMTLGSAILPFLFLL